MAEIRAGLANFSFRQLPSASADAQHMCGRKLEDGKRKIIREAARKFPQMAEIRAGLAKFSFRQLPQTPNTCAEGSWKMERGE